MPQAPSAAELSNRAVITVSGADWRGFLQGLITQDVETLGQGEARFGALLSPQGRVLFDLFVIGTEDGCLLDCAADRRDAMIQRLSLYRLRANVEILPSDLTVSALWNAAEAVAGWIADPRLPSLGYRGYGTMTCSDATVADEAVYEIHRLALGVPGPADWADEGAYPIEANFDLLEGIDFRKGCFVGQETTSRMKRRGTIKNRMMPIAFDGESPAPGAELLAGDLRAGQVRSVGEGVAIALLRLDRLETGPLRLTDGRPWRLLRPPWMKAASP
jgi:tRNA-modifying protein YgfZ